MKRDTILRGLPVVVLMMCSLLPAPVQAQVSQQAKLVGTGVLGSFAQQGYSVSLSRGGNTAIAGGPVDNDDAGAAWLFARSRGGWTQQAKLVGTGAIGYAEQGSSVSLSGDGNTAIVGGPFDNRDAGAAWVFKRSDGSKLPKPRLGRWRIGQKFRHSLYFRDPQPRFRYNIDQN